MYIGKCIFQYNWHQLKEECLLKSLKVYNDYINKSHNICSWVTGSLKLLFRNIFIFIFKRHFANLLFLENFKNEETRVWEILVTNSHWLWDLYFFVSRPIQRISPSPRGTCPLPFWISCNFPNHSSPALKISPKIGSFLAYLHPIL